MSKRPMKPGEKKRAPEIEKSIYETAADAISSAAKKAWGSEGEYENKVGSGIKKRIDPKKASEFSEYFRKK